MRGAPRPRSRTRRSSGIIPAYAGSTLAESSTPTSSRDHPRVCGEHAVLTNDTRAILGSSPRMRGAPQRLSASCLSRWDHPRVCGEHRPLMSSRMEELGSSPRMRGAPEKQVKQSFASGIIPAYAGSTWTNERQNRERRDHPRVCGEHAFVLTVPFSFTGSSPRMRGAPRRRESAASLRRIIPAYAGSTPSLPWSW